MTEDGRTGARADGQDLPLPEAMQALAKTYHEPPLTPRDDIWARVQATRQNRPSARLSVRPSSVRQSTGLPFWLGIAALLAIGIGIGRWSAGNGPAPAPSAVASERAAPRPNAALSLATAEHLSRTEAFLTAVRVGDRGPAFSAQARDLLLTTRMLLDARTVTDPRTRSLLEDLELVLVQLGQLSGPNGKELELVNDAMEQREVLPRLRKEL